jgi:GNAT superfamily N-acetyltransferase
MEVIARSAAGTFGEIYAFYVHPDAWGTGVADDLMAAALDALDADGWESALLWLLAENPRARRFYERHGWSFDGEEQILPLPGEPREIRLRRVLARTTVTV